MSSLRPREGIFVLDKRVKEEEGLWGEGERGGGGGWGRGEGVEGRRGYEDEIFCRKGNRMKIGCMS